MEDTGREAFREGRHIRRTWIWLASQSIRVVTKDPETVRQSAQHHERYRQE